MEATNISLRDLIAAQRRLTFTLNTFRDGLITIGEVAHGYLFVDVDMSHFESAGMVEQVWATKAAAATINAALHAHPELSWSAEDSFKLTVDTGEVERWRPDQRPTPEEA